MVLHHMLPQEHRIPLPLIVVVVHREVENLPVGAVVPVLGAVGGEHRVLRRKDKRPAGGQPPENILRQRPEIPDIVEGQGAEHHIKAALREGQVLHGGAAVLDGRGAVFDPGRLQHLLRQVGPQDIGRPVPGGVAAVPAVAAAQVQHPLPGKIRQEFLQLPPLPRPLQALGGAEHLAVFLEKDRIVIGVFFHGIPLFWFFRAGGGFLQLDKALTFTVFSQRKRNAGGPVCRPYGFTRAYWTPGWAGLGPAPTANKKPAAFFW